MHFSTCLRTLAIACVSYAARLESTRGNADGQSVLSSEQSGILENRSVDSHVGGSGSVSVTSRGGCKKLASAKQLERDTGTPYMCSASVENGDHTTCKPIIRPPFTTGPDEHFTCCDGQLRAGKLASCQADGPAVVQENNSRGSSSVSSGEDCKKMASAKQLEKESGTAYMCSANVQHGAHTTCKPIIRPPFTTGPDEHFTCCDGQLTAGELASCEVGGLFADDATGVTGCTQKAANSQLTQEKDQPFVCAQSVPHGQQMACSEPFKPESEQLFLCCDGSLTEATTCDPPPAECERKAVQKQLRKDLGNDYMCPSSVYHGQTTRCSQMITPFKKGDPETFLCCDGNLRKGESCSGPPPVEEKPPGDCRKTSVAKQIQKETGKNYMCLKNAKHSQQMTCKVIIKAPLVLGDEESFLCCDGKAYQAETCDGVANSTVENAGRGEQESVPEAGGPEESALPADKLAFFERMYKIVFQDSDWGGSKELQLIQTVLREFSKGAITQAGMAEAMQHFCNGDKYKARFQSEAECGKHKPAVQIDEAFWSGVIKKYKIIFQDSEWGGTKAQQTLLMVERECQKGVIAADVRDAVILKLCTEFKEGYSGGKGAFKDEPQCIAAASGAASGPKKTSSVYMDKFDEDYLKVYIRPPVKKKTKKKSSSQEESRNLENPVTQKTIESLTFYGRNRFVYAEVVNNNGDWYAAAETIVQDACSEPCTTTDTALVQDRTGWDEDGDGEISEVELFAMCDACMLFFSDLGRRPVGAKDREDEAWNRNYGPAQEERITPYMEQLYKNARGQPLIGDELQQAKKNAGPMGMVWAFAKLYPSHGKLPSFFAALESVTRLNSAGSNAWSSAIEYFAELGDEDLSNAYKANCVVMPKILGIEEAQANAPCVDRIKAAISERNFQKARCIAVQSAFTWQKLALADDDMANLASARMAEPQPKKMKMAYVQDATYIVSKDESKKFAAFVQADEKAKVEGNEPMMAYTSTTDNTWAKYENDVYNDFISAVNTAREITEECIEKASSPDVCSRLEEAMNRHLVQKRTLMGAASCTDNQESCIRSSLFSKRKTDFRTEALTYVGNYELTRDEELDSKGVMEVLDVAVKVWRNIFDFTVPDVKSSLFRRWTETATMLGKCGMFERCMNQIPWKRTVDTEIAELERQRDAGSRADRLAYNRQIGSRLNKKTWLEDMCAGPEQKGGLALCEPLDVRLMPARSAFPPRSDDEAYGAEVSEAARAIWCELSLESFQEAVAYALRDAPGWNCSDTQALRLAQKIDANSYSLVTENNAEDVRESGPELWAACG